MTGDDDRRMRLYDWKQTAPSTYTKGYRTIRPSASFGWEVLIDGKPWANERGMSYIFGDPVDAARASIKFKSKGRT